MCKHCEYHRVEMCSDPYPSFPQRTPVNTIKRKYSWVDRACTAVLAVIFTFVVLASIGEAAKLLMRVAE